ncbi:hypothetical protein [Paracoccus sp. (in: a-proteobacteria)]|uniref:hypothetical protein n=1 Tax=Paracoccus sp. TaxID=267 RepID=UPI0032204A0E
MRRPGLIRKTHDIAPRDMRDRFLLLAAFLAGAGGGIALKLMGAHPIVAALYAAMVLVVYAVATYSSTHLRLEPEAIGDNCYYLGFLFTLTSLSVTLYFVVDAGAERRAELIPEVISGFGVALSSTIMGVFLRVLMMQFRVDVVVREQQTRLELDMAARELREEMARGLRQFKSFNIEALQLAHERETAMRAHSDALLTESRAQMRRGAELLQEAIQSATREQTAAAMTAIRDQAGAAMHQVTAAIQDASIAILDAASTAFGALEAEKGAVTSFRMTVSDEIGRVSQSLAGASAQMSQQSDRMAQALAQATSQYEDAARRLSFATAALDVTLTTPPARQSPDERARRTRAELDEARPAGE